MWSAFPLLFCFHSSLRIVLCQLFRVLLFCSPKVTVDIGRNEIKTVVCGGSGYNVGDIVAFMHIGTKLKKKVVELKDMEGEGHHACSE